MLKPRPEPTMDGDFSNARYNSPKRKRQPPAISTIPPTPPTSSPPRMMLDTVVPLPREKVEIEEDDEDREEKQGSPRTKVAYNFQGLRLEDAGEVGRLDFTSARGLGPVGGGDRDEAAVRKRVKILSTYEEDLVEIPETPEFKKVREGREQKFEIIIGRERGTADKGIAGSARGVVLSNEVDPVVFRGSGDGEAVLRVKTAAGLARAYPSINRLADSKSRKKRSGTPPMARVESEEERNVVDEERAALTWHDDEITGHDPDDPDDDGEGINGIGFKPTPAEAYARAQKRRAQMAEYRNREAREARKMRSERRRGSERVTASREEAETARRVRFMEAEVKSIISIN